ncbi:MAG: hypothetical protein NTY33_01640 [Candidatus Moranbacteria bacterium]|nr:hypothetical protein [Candidatus Moranbacteria bacterium]
MEKYSFENAQDEAMKMQDKIKSGTKGYNEAERLVVNEQHRNTVEKKLKEEITPLKEIIPGINLEKEDVIMEDIHCFITSDQPYIDEMRERDEMPHKTFIEEYKKLKDNPEKQREFAEEHINNYALSKLKDQVLIDLGASNIGGLYLASLAEAKGYVGVERDKFLLPTTDKRNQENLTKLTECMKSNDIEGIENHLPCGMEVIREDNITPIKFNYVESDMLNFLSRLPNNSVSVLCSGLETYESYNREYMWNLAKEVARVLHPDGALIQSGGGTDGISKDYLKHNGVVRDIGKVFKKDEVEK